MTDMQEPTIFVEGGDEYDLFSNEDKTAYRLVFKTEGLTVPLEGEQLEAFHKEYDIVKKAYPQYGPDQRLAQIWDQGGYSWLAAEAAGEDGA
jgi:hypothetical protein